VSKLPAYTAWTMGVRGNVTFIGSKVATPRNIPLSSTTAGANSASEAPCSDAVYQGAPASVAFALRKRQIRRTEISIDRLGDQNTDLRVRATVVTTFKWPSSVSLGQRFSTGALREFGGRSKTSEKKNRRNKKVVEVNFRSTVYFYKRPTRMKTITD
jgi:hypothetical protein